MRDFFTLLIFSLIGFSAFAQPANDNCDGLIDLGPVPACNTDVVYTNVDATASDIGFGNSPSCFNGGTAQNDVWFAFQTTADITDITITIIGSLDGTNGPIMNPQVALYRGDCTVDGLAELACNSSPDGSAQVQLDLLGLTPDITYFIRINDYSASATPNWGDFTLCIDEYVPAISIGSVPSTTACFGTLYDSGGPDADYSSGEDLTFEICPTDVHSCIELDLVSFNTENNLDRIIVFQGQGTDGTPIATATGNDNNNGFLIQAPNGCVTVQFISDGSVEFDGFELTWQCSPLACDGVGEDNPTQIGNIPFAGSFSTCGAASTFVTTVCNNDGFLGGPEYVFAYDSPGGICASIDVSNGGVAVLDGPPTDPASICVASSPGGFIASANFQEEGTYYIVVANGSGCIDFDINIQEAECVLSPALADALCNPLNGCIDPSGLPTVFSFEDGFQDVTMDMAVNAGCWFGVGAQPDFVWFTIEAQADGPFGFIVESADNPSDIDFNVWGPFTPEEVCESPAAVIDFVTNNQPIRSSYAGGTEPTGLADIHPDPNLGYEIEDTYDCEGTNDDIVQTIPTQAGEVYIVLLNDWGNNIGDAGISIDWAPSAEDVLAPIDPIIIGTDTAICSGQSVEIEVSTTIGSVSWIGDTDGLSCVTCPNPIATPLETRMYTAVVDAVCYNDTLDIEVAVFNVTAGEDKLVCVNEDIQIAAGSNYPNAVYEWEAPAGVELSCVDCADPVVTAAAEGTYEIAVDLITDFCVLSDTMMLTVAPGTAPEYAISENLQICEGATVSIGGPPVVGNQYTWTSNPLGTVSNEANPEVSPTETTTYFLSVLGDDPVGCPFPSLDSLTVEVFELPTIDIVDDVSICQGDSVLLSNTVPESNVTYAWTGPSDIVDPADPNSIAFPQEDGTYILTATRGACVNVDSFTVDITPIVVELNQPDTLTICRGTEVPINAFVVPAGDMATWTSTDGAFDGTVANQITAAPESITTYIARVDVPGCFRQDTITIVVDSLPALMDISPLDTTICEGSLVVMTSPIYDPSDFPEIEFEWLPSNDPGFQTPDSLYNMVISGIDTTLYRRVAKSGICRDTFMANVNVNPIPVVTLDPPTAALCEGETIQLLASSDIGYDSLTWNPMTDLSCTDCPDPEFTPSGFGLEVNISVTATKDMCPGSASANFTITAEPRAELIEPPLVCPGTEVQLNTLDDGISTYTWTSSTDPGFSSNDPLLTVMPTTTTTYFLTAVNDCGTLEESVAVEVFDDPQLTVTEDLDVCVDAVFALTANSILPPDFSESFLWEYNGESSTEATLTFDGITETTEFVLTYTYDCDVITETVTVTVVDPPSVTFPEDTLICFNEENFVLNLDPNPDWSYEWSAVEDPGFSSTEPAPAVSPDMTTTYQVTVVAPNCPPVEEEFTLYVIEEADATISFQDTVICAGESVTLTATSTAAPGVQETFLWSVNGAPIGDGPTVTLNDINEDTTVGLLYSYGEDCQTINRSADILIENIFDVVGIEVDPSNEVGAGREVTLTLLTQPDTINDLTYEWFANDDDMAFATGPGPVTDTPTEDTKYTVIITTPERGCEVMAMTDVMVIEPRYEIPNVFTPNGDGTNDFFNIVTNGIVEVQEFQVYNRWGKLIYDNNNPTQGWDGTDGGDPAPSEVYVYRIVVQPGGLPVEVRSGDVTLIR